MTSSSRISGKLVIAVDVDEVLAQFASSLALFHNDRYGSSLSCSSFFSYEFHKVWGGSAQECAVKMDQFFESHYFHERIEPVHGAYENLAWLKEECQKIVGGVVGGGEQEQQHSCAEVEFHIVTSRQYKIQDATKQWIDKHFPNIFTSLHFGNHYASQGKSRSKPDMCKEINAICLIDDNKGYADQCAAEGIPVLLFGDYAWNQDQDEQGAAAAGAAAAAAAGLVTRVNTWQQAAAEILNRVKSPFSSSSSSSSSSSASSSIASPTSSAALPLVAAIQLCSTSSKSSNLSKIRALVAQAAAAGAVLVCLPECCVFMGRDGAETMAAGETLEGESFSALVAMAKEHCVWLSVGGFPLSSSSSTSSSSSSESPSRVFNHHALISPLGTLEAQYSKIHLFDSPLAGLHESGSTMPGSALAVSPPIDALHGATIGLSVCYDLRFPELYSKLCRPPNPNPQEEGAGAGAARGGEGEGEGGLGASIVLVPSAFTMKTGEAHWEVLLRARAIENQVYVVAAAQGGQHNEKRSSYGHTMIIDPWGNKLAEIKGDTSTDGAVCFAPFDIELLLKTKRDMPVASHRRPDIYS